MSARKCAISSGPSEPIPNCVSKWHWRSTTTCQTYGRRRYARARGGCLAHKEAPLLVWKRMGPLRGGRLQFAPNVRPSHAIGLGRRAARAGAVASPLQPCAAQRHRAHDELPCTLRWAVRSAQCSALHTCPYHVQRGVACWTGRRWNPPTLAGRSVGPARRATLSYSGEYTHACADSCPLTCAKLS
jgi:hypothetical protein